MERSQDNAKDNPNPIDPQQNDTFYDEPDSDEVPSVFKPDEKKRKAKFLNLQNKNAKTIYSETKVKVLPDPPPPKTLNETPTVTFTPPPTSVNSIVFAPPPNETDESKTLTAQETKLNQYKDIATDALLKYCDGWNLFKLSLFGHRCGHHHQNRTWAVIDAINEAKNIVTILAILTNQRDLFQSESAATGHHPIGTLADRWTKKLKNRPKNYQISGYYQATLEALQKLQALQKVEHHGQRQKTNSFSK